MTLNEQDAFNMAIDKLRVLFMAVKGAESIADQETCWKSSPPAFLTTSSA